MPDSTIPPSEDIKAELDRLRAVEQRAKEYLSVPPFDKNVQKHRHEFEIHCRVIDAARYILRGKEEAA